MKNATLQWILLAILIAAVMSLTGCAGQAETGPMPVIDTGVDADAWVTIPAGPVLVGQHEHEMELESDVEMMVTLVTNAQYADYLNAAFADGTLHMDADQVIGYYAGDPFHGVHHEEQIAAGDWVYADVNSDPSRLTWDGTEFTVVAGYENHPATIVTWFGAYGYCDYNGGRLPTNLEWEKAARGEDNRPFPWGNEVSPAHANYLSSQDAFERLSEYGGSTTPVGMYSGNIYDDMVVHDAASPYGLYDMAGNVWQWTADVEVGTHYRSLRGGSHLTYPYNLRIWTNNVATPEHSAPDVGFRCAQD